jgi:putative phosphoesterase
LFYSIQEALKMKILVLSDSHGHIQAMLDAVYEEKPDMILHLGDHDRDCRSLREDSPDILLRAVRGNCDLRAEEPEYDEFVIENKRIYMTHGHLHGVKTSLDSIMNTAFCRGADILLFGHTHRTFNKELQGLRIVNPGSIGHNKTYAVLELEHGAVKCEIKRLNP